MEKGNGPISYNIKSRLSQQSTGPKKCPPGKELNPKTNRCRKIKAAPKKKTKNTGPKKCPPGKELNPKTNRCRKIKMTKISAPTPEGVMDTKDIQKMCPPGKKWTDKTKRCNKIKTPKVFKKTKSSEKAKDVLNNLITINGHGSYSGHKIKVPPGFHILIPHRNGLDQDYTTPDADKDKLYEETLYRVGSLNYMEGWKLYLPGDDINNLGIHTFDDAASCPDIKSNHTLQKELIEKCEGKYHYNKFCPVYCTRVKGSTYDYLLYKGARKLKIKACRSYTLKYLFDNLRNQINKIPNKHRTKISPRKDEPIVLIPFTCNEKSEDSKVNHFNHNNHKKLNTIYQELIKNR